MADSTADKARKARGKAYDAKYMYMDNINLAKKIAKTATGKNLTDAEGTRAGKIIANRRKIDTGRTVARATAIEKRTAKESSAKRMAGAVSGGVAKKQTPKVKTTVKKTGNK
jgi:hypothetical protein